MLSLSGAHVLFSMRRLCPWKTASAPEAERSSRSARLPEAPSSGALPVALGDDPLFSGVSNHYVVDGAIFKFSRRLVELRSDLPPRLIAPHAFDSYNALPHDSTG
jgi:hypothetical protein